jgi:protein gp37
MNKTIISWTGYTWNFIHGCHKVSEGCRHCYAETLSLRYGHTKKPWTKANAAENVMMKPHKLRDPYSLKEPTRIFVNSMSDMFHANIPDWYKALGFAVMLDTPQHTYQILTKRPGRAASWLYDWNKARQTAEFRAGLERLKISPLLLPANPWGDNIWMGTSVEDEKNCKRLDELRGCAAKTRFISFEPLIGEIAADVDLSGFHWAIVGGESGSDFRPMPHAWARNIRDACERDGLAFFFKQSSAPRTEMGTSLLHEDGRFFEWSQYPDDIREPVESFQHNYTYERESIAA